MFLHTKNKKKLEYVKEFNGRHYFIDMETGEEISYADSTFKRYIKQIGTMLEIGITDNEYVLLRQGNYLPKWILGGSSRIKEIEAYIEVDEAGYIRGTYEVYDDERSTMKDVELFKKLVNKFPNILEATSTKPIGVSKVDRELTKQFVLTGLVTLGPNGLYIRKKDLKEVNN